MLPKELQILIDRFACHSSQYQRGDYNETQVRRDFIDKLIGILGWDVSNEEGAAEFYREVIHEDKQKVGGSTKAPDYCIQFGARKLFFIEAKKPAIDLEYATEPAFQLRSYGWSANLPVCLLTSFYEIAIYDTTRKPSSKDKANTARVLYCKYDNLDQPYKNGQTNWDFIYGLFAKDSVRKGSLDKFRQSEKRRGTQLVDEDFLLEIEKWREELANNIIRNNEIDEESLNDVVQKTIDRIIFLRICEDKGIEQEYRLKNIADKKVDIYINLLILYDEADEKYDSGLFHFRKEKGIKLLPDTISHNISIGDKVLRKIIESLYFPSPYQFSHIPQDILGSIYERFLAKKIKQTSSHRCEVEYKPEITKAGGVYYTPRYIVDYIVQNTVSKQLDAKTLGSIKGFSVVDPACGSGSFLIAAYQAMLDWYLKQYLKNKKKFRKQIIETLNGSFKLTIQERKRILTDHIFGVDIDYQAVEVTKLSLMLKALDGVQQQEIQKRLFNERALPNLASNIKCGNTLIGTNYYEREHGSEHEETSRINPFCWISEFKEIFAKGGFDCVIGNPPYGALFSNYELNYFKDEYITSVWRKESYSLFVEQGLKLLKQTGLLGFIIPDTLLNLGFTQSLRELLLQNSKLKEIVGLPSIVFTGATVDTIILLTEKANYTDDFHSVNINIKTFEKKEIITSIEKPSKEFVVKSKNWFEQKAFNIQVDNKEKILLSKIENSSTIINSIADVYSGIKAYEVGKGTPEQTERTRNEKPFTSEKRINKSWQPFFDGKHIGRYELLWNYDNWVKYGVWLAAPRNPLIFEDEKILIRKITGKTLLATYIPETSYCNTLLFVLKLKNNNYSYKFVLGILNSKLIGWYFKKKFQINDDDTFPQIMIRDILQLPIPEIKTEIQHKIVKNVDLHLELHKELQLSTLPSRIKQLKSRIDHNEDQINNSVYALYGLTNKEIEIIESIVLAT